MFCFDFGKEGELVGLRSLVASAFEGTVTPFRQ
jgi:hypothetical protein